MTNNDDFDQPGYEPTEEITQRPGIKSNLAEAWRSKPLFKLVVLMTAVGAIVAAGVGFFSGGSSTSSVSRLTNPPNVHEAPGGPVSPYMKHETELANQNRTEEAIKNGGSAMPTPIGQSTDMGGDLGGEKKNDPLNELKAEVERLRQQQKQQQVQQTQQVVRQQQVQQQPQQQQQFDDSLAQAMQHQMKDLMDSWTPHGIKSAVITKPEDIKAAANGTGGATAAGAASNASTAANQPLAKIIVPAGTVSYGQLLTEANSDVPGPILAQIVSGPLAGARAVGQFQVANGYADYLVLQFNVADIKGKDYPISAVALDPDTTLGGMATEVDQRYFTRVILPAAAGFLQGFGSALGSGNSSISTNGTTTIVQQSREGYRQGLYQGLGQGAQSMSQFFQNQANLTKPLVRVAAGTPIGIFFVTSVQDTTVQQLQQQAPTGVAGVGYPGFPGYGTAGYPAGYGANTGGYPGASPYGSSPYGVSGQNYNQGYANSVPYPNYANTGAQPVSPYSSFSNTPGITVIPGQGVGTTTYGH
jgi:intracellular multiplication protein IcmE